MTVAQQNRIASAIEYAFVSPNELDSNLEAANIVDVLGKLARGIYALGHNNDNYPTGGLEGLCKAVTDGSNVIADAMNNLASAIRESK